MAKSLVILESPNKIKAYQTFLGSDFKVIASKGHVKDLPKQHLGIDVENGFEPQYINKSEQTRTIAEIKRCAQEADTIYLATDPDREGEAIAYHIAQIIRGVKKDAKILRILPQEISKKAILREIAHPTQIDQNKYDSQQARRVLDRLVGYKISPLLWEKVKRGLSAGRVQSVALRLIVDREKAIAAYKKIEYWKIFANLETQNKAGFSAQLVRDKKQTVYADSSSVEKYYPRGVIKNAAEAQSYAARSQSAPFIVAGVDKEKRESKTNPPFSTADLLRCAASQLGFSSQKTSRIAQALFESVDIADGPVGLITYIRTDSVRVSDEAMDACRAYIGEHYGAQYVPAKPIRHELAETPKKKSAVKIQDAHEAIRPTDVCRTPESVKPYLKDKDQYRLYDLIWRRFVASQMAPAVSDVTTIWIENGDLTYRISGAVPKFPGFKRVLLHQGEGDEQGGEAQELTLPEVSKGDALNCVKIEQKQMHTQPPKRYTEATFIKELKDRGIGRPSTLTATVNTILNREYVKKEADGYAPTELGMLVTDMLVESFPDILEVEYTKDMEDRLETIAAGEQSWRRTLADFYGPFSKELDQARQNMRNIKAESEKTDILCEKCSSPMAVKWGKNGHFLACTNYPACKNTKDFERGADGKIAVKEKVVEYRGECPECHRPMIVKNGRNGRFLACSGYPECKHTEAIPLNIACPKCKQGTIVIKHAKKGSKVFYGCNRYPECDYSTWNEPTEEMCPNCKESHLEIVRRGKSESLLCPNCAYSRAKGEA